MPHSRVSLQAPESHFLPWFRDRRGQCPSQDALDHNTSGSRSSQLEKRWAILSHPICQASCQRTAPLFQSQDEKAIENQARQARPCFGQGRGFYCSSIGPQSRKEGRKQLKDNYMTRAFSELLEIRAPWLHCCCFLCSLLLSLCMLQAHLLCRNLPGNAFL